jgi:RNA polymerase sigma-70 factor (ECF subfamily)
VPDSGAVYSRHTFIRVTEFPFDPVAERALVAAARRGERDAMETLVSRLQCIPRFVERLHARLGRGLPRDELPDVVQDVAVVVLRSLDRFHGRVPLEAWIHRICFLTLRNRLRGRRLAPTSLGDGAEWIAATGFDAHNELRADVLEILERIGGVEADIVSMRHIEGLSFEAIATRLGDVVATTKTRYYRAIRRVQERVRMARQREIGA